MLALFVAVAWACPDLEGPLSLAENAAAEVRLEDAAEALAAAESALSSCWADPEMMARFWSAEGVMFALKGEEERSTRSFAAARRVAPALFGGPYGSKMRAAWKAASDEGEATIEIEPAPVAFELRLDGKPWQPGSVSAGLHVVQVGPAEAPEFGEIQLVVRDTVTKVRTGLVEPEQPELAVAPVPVPDPAPVAPVAKPARVKKDKKKKSPVLLIASGGALIAGGTLIGLAANEQAAKIPKAATLEELKSARQRQLGFGYAGYGLVGLGVVGVGVHFAL